MTEKYVLREAARPVLTATVYGRHKHPFLTPPSALSPGERLHELVQETLRGSVMASIPFYNQAKVVALLDSLPALADDARTAFDPILMVLLSLLPARKVQTLTQSTRLTPTVFLGDQDRTAPGAREINRVSRTTTYKCDNCNGS